MNRLRLAGAALCCAALACSPDPGSGDPTRARAPAIHLDGEFDDWAGAAPLTTDSADAEPGSPVDFGRVWAADDPGWMYLSVEVGRAVNVQAMAGELHLVIDADGDAATGGTRWGLDGAEFEIVMSRMDRPQPGGFGAGFGLRPVEGDTVGELGSAYDLGVAALPTHAADRFELRVARDGGPDGFGRLGATVRGSLVAVVDGRVVDRTEPWTYAFASVSDPTAFVPDLTPLTERPAGSFRVAAWNVSEGSFRSPVSHARVLAAVRPDVVLLDEVHGDATLDDLRDFFAHPDLAALGEWDFVLSRGGGRQKTVVAARDRAVRQDPGMVEVRYAPGDLDALRAEVPEAAHPLLDAEAERHLSATGGWVELDGVEILFVPLDFQSAGYAGSPQDALRIVQARTLARHVRDASTMTGREGGVPVVVGGDLNLVGSIDPLRVVSDGLDADGSPLARAALDRLGEASRTTWRDTRQGPFAPGLLDMVLYSDAVLEQVGGFVFATDDLTDAQLARLGLERGLSAASSDHLVVVTDLRLRR